MKVVDGREGVKMQNKFCSKEYETGVEDIDLKYIEALVNELDA